MTPLKDLGSPLKKSLETGVKAAREGMANFNAEEAIQNAKEAATTAGKALETGVGAAQDAIANFNAEEAVQGAKNAASSGITAVVKTIEGIAQKTPEEEQAPSFRDFIALLWCLAHADGSVTAEERQVLSKLSKNLDKDYDSYAKELEQQCAESIERNSQEFGHLNAVKLEAQRAIEAIQPSPAEAKLICWNLIALADSDGTDEAELDLIRYVAEQANVDLAVVEELKNYSQALAEITKATEQLRQSNKSYVEIEPLVNEYGKREETILKAAESLITDR